MPIETWDVVVVGAGAAGLLAAARAAECGWRTLLLEKNPRPGVKILMSGGTRCNVTHATDARGIVAAFGTAGRFLHSALAALGPQDVVQLLADAGVPTKVEEHGKVFPASNKAADVLAALVRRLRQSGAQFAAGEPLIRIERAEAGFHLHTRRTDLPSRAVNSEPDSPSSVGTLPSDGTSEARPRATRNLILTPGGRSYPGCGTAGDGYVWAAELGHTVIEPRPALTPVTTDADWVRSLQGVTIPDVAVRVLARAGRELCHGDDPHRPSRATATPDRSPKSELLPQARGSFLFTHFGLSGPVVLDISRVISRHPRPRELQLVCDFLPGENAERLAQWLDAQCAADGKRRLVNLLSERLPRRLAECLLATAKLPSDRPAAEISRHDRRRVVETCKQTTIPVSGVMGFRKAEVTAGGVCLDEVDSRTMQSKRIPHLFFAGEVLDLDGPIGGYNFQAAFSTGWLAGQSVSEA